MTAIFCSLCQSLPTSQYSLLALVGQTQYKADRADLRYESEAGIRAKISLFTVGSGTFDTVQIKPSAKIRNGYKDLLPEADYVVLASVRDTDAIVMSSDLLRKQSLSAGTIF